MLIVCCPRHLTTVDNRVKKPYRRLFLSEKAYKYVCLLVGIVFFCTFANEKQRIEDMRVCCLLTSGRLHYEHHYLTYHEEESLFIDWVDGRYADHDNIAPCE